MPYPRSLSAGSEGRKRLKYDEPIAIEVFHDQGLVTTADQDIRILKSKKNTLAPISQLPIEIMLQIFMLLVGLPYQASQPWDWLILTKICQTWRNIALDSPCMWREIKHFYNVDKIQAFLHRSRKADLVVVYGNKRKNSFIPDHVINLFSEHMHRVREFIILVDSNGDTSRWNVIWNLFTSPLPRLKILTLQELSSVTPPIPINIFESAAHLDELCIMDLTLPWTNGVRPILRNLSMLSLTYFEDRPQELDLILEILEASPNLCNLELEGLELHPSPSSPFMYGRTITLSQLEYISISPVKAKVFNYLLNHITLPENVTWDIGCSDYSFDQPEPFEPKLLDCSRRCCKDVTITCDDEAIAFTTEYLFDGEELNMEELNKSQPASLCLIRSAEGSAEQNAYSLFASIETILKQSFWSNMTCLTINLLLDDEAVVSAITKSDWLRVLAMIPKIEHLCIQFPWFGGNRGWSSPETALMEAFLEPTNVDDLYKVQCPGLTSLRLIRAEFSTIQGSKAYQSFVNYLYHRSRDGRRLQALCIDECRGIDVNELQSLGLVEICYLD